MKKKISFICLITIISLIGILLYNSPKVIEKMEKLRINQYGEPIKEDGLINNAYFEINANLEDSQKTTNGINEAIRYANKKGIEYLKLEKGKYKIKTDGLFQNNKGILLCSNLTLDLNGSELVLESNNSKEYSVCYVAECQNVRVINGIITGDRNTHQYTGNSTHEWGFAVEIKSSNNVMISGMEIRQTTGDGIYIGKLVKKDNSNEIIVKNSNIYQCRRQGISIISGENIQIINNEIHDINGTNPQSAIDLESNRTEEVIQNIKIAENKLYNLGNAYAIKVQKNIYKVDIQKNHISQDILIYEAKEMVKIKDNIIDKGNIICFCNNDFIEKGYELNKIIIEGNQIKEGKIQITRADVIAIQDNIIENGSVYVKSSNLKLINNRISNTKPEIQVYAYKVESLLYVPIKYYIYESQNQCIGNIQKEMDILESALLEKTNDISKVEI